MDRISIILGGFCNFVEFFFLFLLCEEENKKKLMTSLNIDEVEDNGII